MAKITLTPTGSETALTLTLEQTGEMLALNDGNQTVLARLVERQGNRGMLEMEGRRVPFYAYATAQQLHLWVDGQIYTFEKPQQGGRKGKSSKANASASGEIVAPMPGKILQFKVAAGDVVATDAPLVIMESMKMEMTLSAPFAGTVASIIGEPGQLVEIGTVLVKLEKAGE